MKYPPLGLSVFVSIALSFALFASPAAEGALQETKPVADSSTEPTTGLEPTPLVSNVQLIGASITAGYGNAVELKLGVNSPLAKFLPMAWADHNQGAKFQGNGSNFFFRNPQSTGRAQVAKAKAASPTLVIALDFLFWYGFGNQRFATPRRAEGLEQGLKELEAFACPIIIGTLPNIDHAMKGVGPLGGPVVARSQFPTEAERVAMNERIVSWAAERDHVQVVDVDGMFRSIVAGETLTLRGQEVKMESLRDAFQKDFLHLSLTAHVWTAIAICDAVAKLEGASDADFVFDSAKIQERFLGSIEGAQAKQAERMAKRLAREAARKAKKKEAAIR